MANSWFKSTKNFDINSAQGHWNGIMFASDGINRGEVVVITGEHGDINYEYLLDLWSFALPDVLYISYGHSRDEIIKDYSRARMCPDMKEIGTEKFISVQKEFNVEWIKRAIHEAKPDILFIENIDWTNSLEEKIRILKEIANFFNIAVIVDINQQYVNLDDVLNSASFSKIYYFTNRAVTVFSPKFNDGKRYPITSFLHYFRIIEGEGDPLSAEAQQAKKRFEKFKAKNKLFDWQALEQKKEQQKEKQKEKLQQMQQTFN